MLSTLILSARIALLIRKSFLERIGQRTKDPPQPVEKKRGILVSIHCVKTQSDCMQFLSMQEFASCSKLAQSIFIGQKTKDGSFKRSLL